MPELVVKDLLSLGWFNGYLQMTTISNEPKVIRSVGKFELHDQLITAIGEEFLVNAFNVYMQDMELNSQANFAAAKQLILQFFDHFGIRLFFDPKQQDVDSYDDLMEYGKGLIERTILSLVFDKLEKEADALGMCAFKRIMIPYFLARKDSPRNKGHQRFKQDSKYAPNLLTDLILECAASKQTKWRMDKLVCVQPSGHPGTAVARDKKNEHEVARQKKALKRIPGALKDVLVEKTVAALDSVEQVLEHDSQSMLKSKKVHPSHDYLGQDKRQLIKKEIERVNPFSTERDKVIFKCEPSRVFQFMTEERLKRFLLRNKESFKSNYDGIF